MKTFEKKEYAVKDYIFDWTDWLGVDSIQASSVLADGVIIDSSDFADGKVTVWVSGGTAGEVGSVTCQITTVQGRKEEKTALFEIS